MKEKLFDLIDKQKFSKVFHIISKNASQFPDNQTFRNEYTYNYSKYNGTEQLAYRERLKTFVDMCLQKQRDSKFLTNFFSTKGLKFVGRQAEFGILHALMQRNLANITVQSIGGIGKTTFARCYVERYKQDYQNIVWIEQTSTLIRAFVANQELTADMELEKKTEIERFQAIIKELEAIKGNNLLVIDNYTAHPEDTQHGVLKTFSASAFNHWRVLCTSREKVHRFETIPLGKLSEEEAIELFCIYVPKKRIDETELKELLKLIDNHTLTIELLAKSYQESLRLNSLGELTDILRQNALDSEDLNEPIKLSESDEEKLFYQHLNKVFNILPLSKDERFLLKQFAVLPALPIAGKDFLEWITAKPTGIGKFFRWVGKILGLSKTLLFIGVQNKATYKKALNSLAQKGWLTRHEDKTYEVHRFVRMFLLHKFQPTDLDCLMLYHSFMGMLAKDKVEANPLVHQWLLEYGEALLAGIHFEVKPIWKAYLQNNLAELYINLGIYIHAEKLYQDALYLTKEVLGTKHPNYAIALNNLAFLYDTQGKYTEAEPLYKEALQIGKETIGTQHHNYAIRLNNLAELYRTQGKYTEAEPLYKEALQIDKETIGTQHPSYATHLNNLANLYRAQGKYTEAEFLYKEALQIAKETIGTKHPNYATHLHNLGSMYYKIGRYAETKALLTEAYNIRVATLGEENPDTQDTKKWLEAVKAKL